MNKLVTYTGLFLLFGFLLPLQSQTLLNQTISFEKETFQLFESGEGLFGIKAEGGDFFYKADPGKAALPFLSIKILVPNGAELVDYQVSYDREVFKEDVRLASNPIYWPGSLPLKPSKYAEAVIDGTEGFPDKVLEYTSTQIRQGYTYFCFSASPFIYEGDQHVLYLIKDLDLKLSYTSSQIQETAVRGGKDEIQSIREQLNNPEDIEVFYPEQLYPDQKSTANKLDYLIVTTSDLEDSFAPLVEWKIRKGLKAEIITLSEIYSTYDEPTDQLKIKRCLSNLYLDRNLKWVLLGGDYDIVPIQYCYGKVDEEMEDPTIPTDLFYACFDKSFDWNGTVDDRVGEPFLDYVDIAPEIYISRIPVQTRDQVESFIKKTLNYIQDPPRKNFAQKMLLSGVKSWNIWENKSDSHHRNEQMYSQYISRNWAGKKIGFYDTGSNFPGGELYHVSASNLSQQLNEGYGFFHFAGHGNTYSYLMETGNGFAVEDALELNHPGTGVMLSTTCDVNAFDSYNQCLSEAFLLNPRGGCVAFFGSSRYGLGISNTSALLGPSFQFNAIFLENLFKAETNGTSFSFATIAANAKVRLIGNDSGGGAFWYLQYALNPMGDPELPLYSLNPKEFTDVKIYRWGNKLTVNTGGVGKCRICITSSNFKEGYQQSAEGVSKHTFTDPPENFQVTITRPNYIPYQYKNGVFTAMKDNLAAAVRIYPNPVSDNMYLHFDLDEGEFFIYDIKGRLVKDGSLKHGSNSISMIAYPPGLYILQVEHRSGAASFRLIKE